jgi:acyl-coenzyme A synthetase/AMP-(fatty) acid ligase
VIASAEATSQPSDANVATLLQRAAAEHPLAPTLVSATGDPAWTLAELERSTAELAGALAARGVEPGARVLVLVRDQTRALALVLATIWAGGAALVPTRTRGIRAMVQLAAAEAPDIVIADPISAALCMSSPVLRRALVSASSLHASGAMQPASVQASQPALVTWTTGSTGMPTPVARSHGVLRAQHQAMAHLRGLHPGDIDLVGLPTMALHDLALGVGFALAPRRRRWVSDSLRDLAGTVRATAAAGFPALFERLTDGARQDELGLLRSVQVGGAPVRPEVLERIARAAPRATVSVVYGMTEAEPIASIGASEYVELARGRSPGQGLPVGTPVQGIELRVDQFAGRPCGRVLVRGLAVAAVAGRSDAVGWLDTGDLGRTDEVGRLWLMGRTVNAVSGRYAPAEIEEPVAALPGINAAALVATDDEGVARYVLAVQRGASYSPTSAAEVRALVARCGWPIDRVVVLSRLPRDERSGTKLDYPRLRAMVASSGRGRRMDDATGA